MDTEFEVTTAKQNPMMHYYLKNMFESRSMKRFHLLAFVVSILISSSLTYCAPDKRLTDQRVDKDTVQVVSVNQVVKSDVRRISHNDFEFVNPRDEQMVFPGSHWLAAKPEELGWSSEKLDAAKEFYEKLNSNAAMVIVNGYVIASWGNPTEVIEARSMRKSFLNAAFGARYNSGKIDLNKSLADLNIDDKEKLTEEERAATIEQLLTSKSGIFHPAAYEAGGSMPARGSSKPGERFQYNNWDFNTAGYVFNKMTGEDLFTVFQSGIATPLQMQDFRLENTQYKYESESLYPAYLFSTSARDDARLGLLYLAKGNWNGKQVIPEEWITMSTTKKVDTKRGPGYSGYGYLWWTDTFNGNEIFLARGNSAQYLVVDPANKVVVVFRADPGSVLKKWFGQRVTPQQSWDLLRLIYKAKG